MPWGVQSKPRRAQAPPSDASLASPSTDNAGFLYQDEREFQHHDGHQQQAVLAPTLEQAPALRAETASAVADQSLIDTQIDLTAASFRERLVPDSDAAGLALEDHVSVAAAGAAGGALALPLSDAGAWPLEDAGAFYATTKRALDILISGLLLIVLAPFGLLLAGAIRLGSRGPALYVHRRVGLNGKLFWCLKFRTMCADADRLKEDIASQSLHTDQRTFKMERDPRVTRLGYWLRKLSIDEFPQLYNVLKGEMSLVGPRPAIPSEVARYSRRDRLRLSVTPGLTCIWQVSGRSNLAFDQQLEMDLEYVRQRSLLLDAKLIMLTIPAVLSADGAY